MSQQPQYDERPIVRHLPWILPMANAAICLPLVIVALIHTIGHEPGDMLGLVLLLLLLDFPASLAAQAWTEILTQYCGWFRNSEVAGVVVFSILLLATGFAWYSFVGWILRRLIRRWRGRSAGRRGFPVVEKRN